MAFIDWDQYSSGSTIAMANDTVIPIAGGGSLFFDSSGSGNRQAHMSVSTSSGINKGFTQGEIRTICNVASFTAGFRTGIICLQSQDDVSGIVGSCYTLNMQSRTSSAIDFRLVLNKHTTGLQNVTTLLDETINSLSTLGTDFVMELEWVANLPGLGGTQLTVSFGNNTQDFNNLVTQFIVLDTTSPILTSAGEGVFCKLLSTSTEQVDVRFDNTEIFSLV